MGIWDLSCSIKLKSPLDKESWKVIEDAELDNTDHIYFTTPSGKRVDFIKADVLDKIKTTVTEIECTANEIRQSNTVADGILNILRSCLNDLPSDCEEKEEEETEE